MHVPFLAGSTSAEKIRRAACPCAPDDHELAHESSEGISVNEALDCGPTVGIVGLHDRASRHERGFASGRPEGEISRAGQELAGNAGQV